MQRSFGGSQGAMHQFEVSRSSKLFQQFAVEVGTLG